MPTTARSQFHRVESLSLCAGLTVLAIALPYSHYLRSFYFTHIAGNHGFSEALFADLILIAMGLVLTLPDPRGSGLCIGRIREHWKKVVLIVGGPLLLTAIVYPQLPERPFRYADISMWLTSPLAQDLIFGGVIYRLLRPHFSSRVVSWLPFEWALPIGGLFFSAWHLQNFDAIPAGYVLFQLLYTWAAYTFVGLTRQWTGSLLYVTLAHMVGNFIVWYVDHYDVTFHFI
jgi:membrane protease YdiL (CAAX protease family)